MTCQNYVLMRHTESSVCILLNFLTPGQVARAKGIQEVGAARRVEKLHPAGDRRTPIGIGVPQGAVRLGAHLRSAQRTRTHHGERPTDFRRSRDLGRGHARGFGDVVG